MGIISMPAFLVQSETDNWASIYSKNSKGPNNLLYPGNTTLEGATF